MSKMEDMEVIYARLEAEQAKKAKEAEEDAKRFNDPDMLEMVVGNTYQMRIMYWASGVPGERMVPIIEQETHSCKDSNGMYHEVVCPTSEYLLGRNGFKICPICTENSKLWKEAEAGSTSAKVAYTKFKRRFKGYAIVYVIDSPTSPENNGKFKKLYINTIVNEQLNFKIDGLDKKKNPVNIKRKLGINAFRIDDNGWDLDITMSNDGKHNKYACEFNKGEALPITMADVEKAFETLNLDMYYKNYDINKLNAFYENVVLEKCQDSTPDVTQESEPDVTQESEPDVTQEVKPEVKPKRKIPTPDAEVTPTVSNVDIDDILNGLPI